MGVHNNFSPPGTSSYELKNLTGCFSYMTAEQLCNWSLLAALGPAPSTATPTVTVTPTRWIVRVMSMWPMRIVSRVGVCSMRLLR